MLSGLHHRDRNGEGRRNRAFRPGACEASALLTELRPHEKWWEVLADGHRSAARSASRMSNGGRAQAPLLVSYTPNEMERVNGIAPLSRPWHGRILLLNYTRKGLVSPAGLSPAT
jgi:hypothetical protein